MDFPSNLTPEDVTLIYLFQGWIQKNCWYWRVALKQTGLNQAAQAVKGDYERGLSALSLVGLGRAHPGFYVAENAYSAIMKRVSYVILPVILG